MRNRLMMMKPSVARSIAASVARNVVAEPLESRTLFAVPAGLTDGRPRPSRRAHYAIDIAKRILECLV